MSNFISTNLFDLAIYICLFIAVVLGFMTGLLRSLATIIGYVCGMGVAVAAGPKRTPPLTSYLKMPTPQTWIGFVALFFAAGAGNSALLRFWGSGMIGPHFSIPRRLAGGRAGALSH